ncbi:MAG: TetR/AcrR family transcriptional regulator [Coriobacteriales bacterium]|jgi:AcrR family transcriptional regulator|nr:TetR/AcrR family transcriptional regulator [Coriobacteriales bacterium]
MARKAETTKGRILKAALALFSTDGFDATSMRAIAKAVGINVGSIYNHFDSKEAILYRLYEYYAEQHRKARPQLDELLKLVETQSPQKVFETLEYGYPPEVSENISRVFMIASRRVNTDPISIQFIRENLFDDGEELIIPVLDKMMELGRIEPIDSRLFAEILIYHSFCAASYSNTPFRIQPENWRVSRKLIFSLIRPR